MKFSYGSWPFEWIIAAYKVIYIWQHLIIRNYFAFLKSAIHGTILSGPIRARLLSIRN